MELDRKDLHDNYEALHDSTGESWASIADRVEAIGDKALAAELRGKHSVGSAQEARKDPPKERRSTAHKPVTASGDK